MLLQIFGSEQFLFALSILKHLQLRYPLHINLLIFHMLLLLFVLQLNPLASLLLDHLCRLSNLHQMAFLQLIVDIYLYYDLYNMPPILLFLTLLLNIHQLIVLLKFQPSLNGLILQFLYHSM